MQSVCMGKSRPEGFWGRFFWSQLGFWSQAISITGASQHHWSFSVHHWSFSALHRTSRRSSRPHEASWRLRRFTAQPGFSYTSRFGYSFWLQLWLQDFPRTAMFFYRFICFISLVANVAKKSSKSFWDREDPCIRNAQLRSRPEKFLRPFFLPTSGILATALSVTGASQRPPCVTGASPSGRALWPGDLRASARTPYGCACPGLRSVQRHKYQQIHWSGGHEDRD